MGTVCINPLNPHCTRDKGSQSTHEKECNQATKDNKTKNHERYEILANILCPVLFVHVNITACVANFLSLIVEIEDVDFSSIAARTGT